MDVRAMTPADWPQVETIYAAGIATGDATFETEPPTWEHFDASRLADHRYVAVDHEDRIAGWIAASKVSDRCVYGGVVEHSVYVAPQAHQRGVGRALLGRFVAGTEAAGIWTVQSGVFPENVASLALHRAVGFRVVGTRDRIGRLDGVWRDVVMIERRSPLVGG